MEPVVIDAPDVRLRPHRQSDIEGMVDQCSDAASQLWTTVPSPYRRTDAEQYLNEIAAGWREQTMLAFAVTAPPSDDYLGTVNLRLDGAGAADLGFGLRPVGRGNGLMTAAVRSLTGWALDPDHLGLEVLHWRALVGNWASRRVAWRTGFRIEGTVRGFLSQRGERRDGWVGSLRRGDPIRPANEWLTADELTGETIRLRPFRETDAAAIVEACTHAVTRHWLAELPDPYTAETALAYVHGREEEHAKGTGVFWCAADIETDACLGSFGLMHLPSSPELGYWVHPAARGRGVATAATRLICDHAFASADQGGLGLRRIDLRAAESNAASRRVAERAGFVSGGVLRGAELLGDGTHADLVLYERHSDRPFG